MNHALLQIGAFKSTHNSVIKRTGKIYFCVFQDIEWKRDLTLQFSLSVTFHSHLSSSTFQKC